MRIEYVSLFPELIEYVMQVGILGRAQRAQKIVLAVENPRDFAHDKHRTVDDTPYGGGSGMVMMAPPILDALDALNASRPVGCFGKTFLLSPRGPRFSQPLAIDLAKHERVTFVCGRYEGVDARVLDYVDGELSLGDFVMLGGELAALSMTESIVRLLPGVLGNAQSAVDESFSDGDLLEYDHYTRPPLVRGKGVPEVLLSGNHGEIEAWRRAQSVLKTSQRRQAELCSINDGEHEER